MNTDTLRTSAVTDEEYHRAITNHQRREVQLAEAQRQLVKAEELEQLAYKYLKKLRATIAAETLETINGR